MAPRGITTEIICRADFSLDLKTAPSTLALNLPRQCSLHALARARYHRQKLRRLAVRVPSRICTNHDLVPGNRIAPELSTASPSIISSTAFSGRFKNFFISVLPFLSQSQFDFTACPLPIWKRTFASITARFINC
jgi:hypothetical protein